MTLCYLALGSNLNGPERQIRLAVNSLRKLRDVQVIKVASLYFNKAWGRKAQPDFCNTVIAVKTILSPELLLKICQKIEHKQGRHRKLRWGSRSLDIDIILYGSLSRNSPELTIPHPRMHERDFVLIPLHEIASHNKNFYLNTGLSPLVN